MVHLTVPMKKGILIQAFLLFAATLILAASFFLPNHRFVSAVSTGSFICPVQNDVNFYLRWRSSQASYLKDANVQTNAIDPGRISNSNVHQVNNNSADISIMEKVLAIVDARAEMDKK